MIALDVQLMSVVEDIGFMKLLYILDPRYQPPSRKTVSCSILPQKYGDIKSQIQKRIEYCALTMDIWTSRQTLGYITVTCHYIDDL